MAPGLNGRQTGTVPKNKQRSSGSQSHRTIREALLQSTSSLEWEPVLDQNSRSRNHRKISSAHSETEEDSIRYNVASSMSPTMTSQMRYEETESEGNSQEIHGARFRVNVPDKKQVINKITQIQDYIQQTATLMNALKSSDCPEKIKQFEKLSAVQDDLKDSETKLLNMLKSLDLTESKLAALSQEQGNGNNSTTNSDTNEEDLVRRSEESKKKLEVLQKRKQELIELQEKARKQLQEAQLEQSRLVARASSLNRDITSNRFLDLNVQQLSERLKAAKQLYKTSNQINDALADGRQSNTQEAEHPDEDQVETSDTETEFQMVSDKVAELNAMKAQLAQIQKLMANISMESSSKDGSTTSADINDERREQITQHSAQVPQQKAVRNEVTVDENINNAVKLEQAKMKLNQLTQLLEIAQSAQGSKELPASYFQLAPNMIHSDGDSIRQSPSPCCSNKSQQRPCEEVYVETMQLMTRELEEKTAAMKEEHERLIAARQELEHLARKIPLIKPERISLSPDDSGSEAPCLTNITVDSNGRFISAGPSGEQQSVYEEQTPFAFNAANSKPRQRGVWNTLMSSRNPGSLEKKLKNEDVSRSLHSLNGAQSVRDQPRWCQTPTMCFCEGAASAAVQNSLEKADNLCGRIFHDSIQRTIRPEELTLEEVYSQHQLLTRTVAQCSQLLWLQQKQIIELRNSMMLQQTAAFQNMVPQPMFGNQSQRHTPVPHQSLQINSLPNVPFPSAAHPSQISIQQQEQHYMSPNQSIKLNSGSVHNIQTNQEYIDQFYHNGITAGNVPVPVQDGLEYQFRYGNCNRTTAQHINSNSNVNQNLNQNGASGLNNRIPVGGMSCLGPEDSGALNNQVPPGNRANNYWDNFRSYSRQNLLSHAKSNEDTDSTRRSSTTMNQERQLRETSSSVMHHAAVSSHEVVTPGSPFGVVEAACHDECQFPMVQPSTSRSNQQPQVSRSRSVEVQSNKSSVKNESRNQENDSRNLHPKNDAGSVRSRISDCSGDNRSVRNDVNQNGRNSDVNSSRNFVQLVRDLDTDDGRLGMNKKRMDKSRSRNEGRANFNNRTSTNQVLPLVLRDNVYSEMTNFIKANENRPHFLIQLFRDLQQVTTDPLRQRTLESIQETVNANNLTERSSNLNIIDNRNNIRESRSNLNRNHGDEPVRIDDFVCQMRENQNAIRQNSAPAGTGNNLENPNISNIRNLGNSRNNLESEGLRDLRTYFEANLCNFGHNSALENPNLSNIRENLTRRGTAGSELENSNPKNLYFSMYDNIGRRNQESLSGPEVIQYQSSRMTEQIGSFSPQNSVRDNVEVSRSNQVQASPSNSRSDERVDGNTLENHQVISRTSMGFFSNVAIENDSQEDNSCNNGSTKRSFTDGSNEVTQTVKKEDTVEDGVGSAEEAGAVAAALSSESNKADVENKVHSATESNDQNRVSSLEIHTSDCSCLDCGVPQLDYRDLAEADQSRGEKGSEAELNATFSDFSPIDVMDLFCVGNQWVMEEDTEEESLSQEEDSVVNLLYENRSSEPEGSRDPSDT